MHSEAYSYQIGFWLTVNNDLQELNIILADRIQLRRKCTGVYGIRFGDQISSDTNPRNQGKFYMLALSQLVLTINGTIDRTKSSQLFNSVHLLF